MMVDLEASGMSYVEVDRANKEIKLYHLDHSLFKTVSYANVPLPANPITTVYLMYISEHLFDQDDGLEFMYLDPTPGTYLTQVYNEDGSLLLDEPGSQPLVLATVHNQQYPIYNTDQGTKLILSHTDGTARVYSLGAFPNIGSSIRIFQFPISAWLTIIPAAFASDSVHEGHFTRTLWLPALPLPLQTLAISFNNFSLAVWNIALPFADIFVAVLQSKSSLAVS